MNLAENLVRIVTALDAKGIRYALIGGMAMAMRGVQRATLDLDFILLSDDLDESDAILHSMGYDCAFRSANVTHYQGRNIALGRVDFLHAFRPATLGMLERAQRLPLTSECSIPVVHLEDLIGLKIQAACNDPSRRIGDWNDIHLLVSHAGLTGQSLDWELLGDYLAIFDQSHQLPTLQQLHGAPQQA
ncbi:MAG: nucleotidyl transferase AbiEii/AbiGii toxin family protein [Verrucomicrobia bacterium]|nr:nucleotidyl transferase AbiEii/AbiGii toxin family protein [Verrucomicrobiota bacterium]